MSEETIQSNPAKRKTERHYLEVLRAISLEAVIGSTPEGRLSGLARIVANELHWDAVSIYLIDNDSDEIILAASHGLSSGSVGKVSFPVSEGLVGSAVREERPVFLEDAANDPRFLYLPETGEEKFRSLGAVPFARDGKVTGVLTVQTVKPCRFSTADTHFLEILASQIGQAVDVAVSLKSLGERKPTILVGIPSSPGVGEARAHLMASSPDQAEFLARGFRGLDMEKKLFDNARQLAIEELDSLASQMGKIPPAASNILLAHKTILHDPDLIRKVHECIKLKRESAPRAVAFIMDEYIMTFASYKNKIMREKTQDIKDLRDMLLRLMGEKVSQFAPEFEEESMVLVARELTPQQTARLSTEKVSAIVTERGGEFSHAAILARALGLPAVLGISGLVDWVKPGDRLLVDGSSGFVYINPDETIKDQYLAKSDLQKKRSRAIRETLSDSVGPAQTLCGKVSIDANIGLPFEIEQAVREGMGSVGLFRTEFYYMKQNAWPDEENQIQFYERLFNSFKEGSVTVRLMDLGGDKNLSYMPQLDTMDSCFGFRSVRLLLDHPEVLSGQLRSIHLAAEKSGTTPRILIPMVTQTWEITAVRETLLEITDGKGYPLGIMVEIPGVLFEVEELLEEADFINIGTNDLAQYLLAVDRNDPRTRHLYHPLHPSLIRALDFLFRSVAVLTRPFSVCGEMAGDPLSALALLIIGYRSFSISPSGAYAINYLARQVPEGVLARLRAPMLRSPDPADSEKMLRGVIRKYAPLVG